VLGANSVHLSEQPRVIVLRAQVPSPPTRCTPLVLWAAERREDHSPALRSSAPHARHLPRVAEIPVQHHEQRRWRARVRGDGKPQIASLARMIPLEHCGSARGPGLGSGSRGCGGCSRRCWCRCRWSNRGCARRRLCARSGCARRVCSRATEREGRQGCYRHGPAAPHESSSPAIQASCTGLL
jgi:hypothetical protein